MSFFVSFCCLCRNFVSFEVQLAIKIVSLHSAWPEILICVYTYIQTHIYNICIYIYMSTIIKPIKIFISILVF
jgi:hypothetical protein